MEKSKDWDFNKITRRGTHKSGLMVYQECTCKKDTVNINFINETSWYDMMSEKGMTDEQIEKLKLDIGNEYIAMCKELPIRNGVVNYHIPTKEEKIAKILAFKEHSRRLGMQVLKDIYRLKNGRWREDL